MIQSTSKVKIKSIKVKGIEDVYNMEVEDTHCFSINGGYIVHNCRYGTESIWSNQNASFYDGIDDSGWSLDDLGL